MKSLFKYLLLLLGCVSFVALPVNAEALDSDDYAEIGEVIDGFQGAAEDVAEASGKLHEILADKNNDATRELIMDLLDKVGVDGGWAKQIGKLKKIKGASEFMSKALTGLGHGATAIALIDAYSRGDKNAFQDIVADEITSVVASWLGDMVRKAIIAKGQGAVVGSIAGGPIAVILAEAGVLIGGWALGEGTEWLVTQTINETAFRDYLEQLGGAIFDALRGEGDGDGGNTSPGAESGGMCPIPEGPNPFDAPPESGEGGKSGKEERFQGLKPIKLF